MPFVFPTLHANKIEIKYIRNRFSDLFLLSAKQHDAVCNIWV